MQNLFDDFLSAFNCFCGIIGIIFIMFAELWVAFFQTFVELTKMARTRPKLGLVTTPLPPRL